MLGCMKLCKQVLGINDMANVLDMQWNLGHNWNRTLFGLAVEFLCDPDTLGTEESVLISEVS